MTKAKLKTVVDPSPRSRKQHFAPMDFILGDNVGTSSEGEVYNNNYSKTYCLIILLTEFHAQITYRAR